MTILGIETSCDETGAAIVSKTDKGIELLSQSLATSLNKHAQTGGIIPEVAAREQVKFIIPTIEIALKEAFGYTFSQKFPPPIDTLAVTYGPGLIGSLLVGVETAKTLSMHWSIPLIPVNHMYGHIYANFFENPEIIFPALALVVSGGHTDLVLLTSHHQLTVLGGTRDDAAGEAFDKIGRLLGLPYPAGPTISHLAEKGDEKAFILPRPMIGSKDFSFSFSGLKTAVFNLLKKNEWNFNDKTFSESHQQLLFDLCASVEYTIVSVLTRKTIAAAKEMKVKSVLLSGGVAANKNLRKTLHYEINNLAQSPYLSIPSPELCTDNGAMIAAAGAYSKQRLHWTELSADPSLYY